MMSKSKKAWWNVSRWRSRAPTVAVVRLNGVIGVGGTLRRGLSLAAVAPSLERAFRQKHLAAVALAVNSPGGSPVQSSLIATRIRALAGEHEVPVIAFAEDVAASGGYWLAAAADEIYADPSSVVGSIGVISGGFGFPAVLERLGIERRVRTAGTHKDALDPFAPQRDEDVAHLDTFLADIHETFRAAIRERRGDRLQGDEMELFSGRWWSGRQALDLGLIDGLGDLKSVLKDRFGEDVRFRLVGDRMPWWRRRLATTDLRWGAESAQMVGVADGLIAAIEERLMWNRYGL